MKIKSLAICLLLISGFHLSHSQINDINGVWTILDTNIKYNHISGISASTFISSNSLNSKFLNKLYDGGFIDNETKNSVSLQKMNSLGNKDIANIYYCYNPDSAGKNGYRVGLSYNNSRSMKFSDDIYKLIFFGNKQFAGKKADLSNFAFNTLSYNSIQFGIFNHLKQDNDNLSYYIGFSLISASDFESVEIANSSLYTAESGEYLDLDLQMGYSSVDTVNNVLYEFNGIGAAIDIQSIYHNREHNYLVRLDINNIGFIKWKKQSFHIMLDTSRKYEGLVIDDVFDMDNNDFSDINIDSIVTDFYDKADTANIYTALPERFHLSFTKIFNDKISSTIGAAYYFNSDMNIPMFYNNNKYNINDKFDCSLLLGYGGYSSYHVGLGAGGRLFDNKIVFSVRTNNILGFIAPEFSYSQSVFVNLGYRF